MVDTKLTTEKVEGVFGDDRHGTVAPCCFAVCRIEVRIGAEAGETEQTQ